MRSAFACTYSVTLLGVDRARLNFYIQLRFIQTYKSEGRIGFNRLRLLMNHMAVSSNLPNNNVCYKRPNQFS